MNELMNCLNKWVYQLPMQSVIHMSSLVVNVSAFPLRAHWPLNPNLLSVISQPQRLTFLYKYRFSTCLSSYSVILD